MKYGMDLGHYETRERIYLRYEYVNKLEWSAAAQERTVEAAILRRPPC